MEVHETCLIAPKYFWDQRRVLLMRVLLTGLLPLAHLRTLHSEGARESMRMRHPVHPDANLSVRFVQLYDTRALSQRVAGNQSAMTVAFTTRSCYPNGSGAASRTRPCTYLTIPPKTRLTLNAIHSSPSHPNSTGRRVLSPSGFGKARTITAARFDGFNANVA